MSCGYDGGEGYSDLKASLHAKVEAGKTITAYYDNADFDPAPHYKKLEYAVRLATHSFTKHMNMFYKDIHSFLTTA